MNTRVEIPTRQESNYNFLTRTVSIGGYKSVVSIGKDETISHWESRLAQAHLYGDTMMTRYCKAQLDKARSRRAEILANTERQLDQMDKYRKICMDARSLKLDDEYLEYEEYCLSLM